MKTVIVPDSFKGTLSSDAVIAILKAEIARFYPKTVVEAFPLADGGEGTVSAYLSIFGSDAIKVTRLVYGPFIGEKVNANYAIIEGRTAVIEAAQTCGQSLAEGRQDPRKTTTYGLGEQIEDALNKGYRTFKIGLGGSSTNDFGSGMAVALGVRFFNAEGETFIPTGGTLNQVTRVDIGGMDDRIKEADFTVLSDVDNPLLGPQGASYVYAPQKGATTEMLPILEKNMTHLNEVIHHDLDRDVSGIRGSGAAGGLGAACLLYLNAVIHSGVQELLHELDFGTILDGADLVITGEGHIDPETLHGKGVEGVARFAKVYHVPVLAIGGRIDEEVKKPLMDDGVTDFLAISAGEARPLSELRKTATEDLRKAFDSYLAANEKLFKKR
jgi:glycerate kinase